VTAAVEGPKLKRDLALACRILGANGHGDNIYGHVSVRAPGTDRYWMKAQHLGLEEITEDDLVLLDRAGNVLEGKRARHIEYPIHAEVLRARPDVTCVVHTHPPYSVAAGARRLDIRPIGHEGALFWPPGVPIFDEFTDLVTTTDQGERVAKALGSRVGLFLMNHGIVVAASSVALATVAAITLEKAAFLQLLAQPTPNSTVEHTTASEAETKRARIWSERAVEAQWRYFVRRLGPTA
jgi:ribulose-5-phosphate 4-epimerase/fuculose-1-phosphate aldolase